MNLFTQKRNIGKIKFSKNIPTGKAIDNNTINNLPDVNVYTKQNQITPKPASSTVGLFGFENDSKDVVTSILKGQIFSEDSLINKLKNDTFGKLQIDTLASGGTQSKTISLNHDFLSTLDQQELAKLTGEQKIQLQKIYDKLKMDNPDIAIHQLTFNQIVDAFGKQNNKEKLSSNFGLTNFIDNLNNVVRGKIESVKLTGAKSKDKVEEIKTKTTDQNLPNSTPEALAEASLPRDLNLISNLKIMR